MNPEIPSPDLWATPTEERILDILRAEENPVENQQEALRLAQERLDGLRTVLSELVQVNAESDNSLLDWNE